MGDSIDRRAHAELDQSLDVGRHRAREAPDLSLEPGGEDELDRAAVVLGDAGEAGLDPVDAEDVERAGDLQLVLRREHDADGLLAVAQGRVVEPHRPAAPERLVDAARPDPVPLDHVARKSSGKDESRSAPSAVTRKLSSRRSPPPPSQYAARLDRQHHAFLDDAASGLVRVRRLVRPRPHAVRDGVRRLSRVAGLGDPVADEAVELGQARPRARGGRSQSGRPRAGSRAAARTRA